jgi:hypothetical protein
MAVAGHPQLEAGVTGMVLRRRPHAGPVRAAVRADADQVEGLGALLVLGCKVVLEQHQGWPVPAGEPGPDLAGRLGDQGSAAGLGDDGQVPRRLGRGGPDPKVRDALPACAARWVTPEWLIGDQLSEGRQVAGRGGRQGLHDPSLPGGAAAGNEPC